MSFVGGFGGEIVAPQETGWMLPKLIPQCAEQPFAAADVQIGGAHRQPETQGKGDAEVQDSGGRQAGRRPAKAGPGKGSVACQRTYVIRQ